MKIALSVTVLTKNSQRYLREVLSALDSFDEIVVYDTGSEDRTLEMAREFSNISLYEGPFIGFGPTHNRASACARHDWILSIDSDEIVTPALAREIAALKLTRGHVYSFPRHNEYRGKWIRWCGWHPDRQIRLYHRLDTQFTEAQVHESIEWCHLKEVPLCSPLRHYSYQEISEFLHKMQLYTSLFARQYQGKKGASFGHALFHGGYAFLRSYFLKRGFLGGREGFEISLYNANTAFYKYLKLAEANRLLVENEKKKEN
jgi:glycosyltransferase involved in cell wall biosynthesis